MSRRMFFVKLNLDELGHDLAIMDKMPSSAYEAWLRGFNKGSRGIAPDGEGMDPGVMGQRMGFKAWSAAQAFSASRAANRAGGSKKRKERIEKPEESSVTTSDPHMSPHMSHHMSPGATAPDPAPDRRPYDRFAQQYQTPKPEPVVLPWDETPEGKACLARREALRAARRAREQQTHA